MKFTHHRFRLALGLLICAVGVTFFFLPGLMFHRAVDGIAWLLIGALFYFFPEFHLRFTRQWVALTVGFLIAAAGLLLTGAAIFVLLGPRPHGLLPFYEFIGIGPLLLTTGILVGFYPKDAG
jgi:hypothetical protein